MKPVQQRYLSVAIVHIGCLGCLQLANCEFSYCEISYVKTVVIFHLFCEGPSTQRTEIEELSGCT